MNRYQDIREIKSANGITHKINTIYPEIPPSESDFYVRTTAGDRYDILASQFYGDASLWWIIAAANTAEQASLVPTPGIQIRIPGNKEQIIQLYNKINNGR